MRQRRTRSKSFSGWAQQGAQAVPVSPHDDLYFFRADNGLVKIGRSANVRNRLNHIRCSSPVGVMMWAVIEGQGHQELLWHSRFKEFHRSGEWFKWCPQIARAVRLAQSGKDWWKDNIKAADSDDDKMIRKLLVYWRSLAKEAA
jgi:hypothetical protein